MANHPPLLLHLLLSLYCLVACLVNHIDDTDETFGYFEPLHFLLHGKGMQTWEYSPEFAIRTYAFVLPLVPVCRLLSFLGCSKTTVFFCVRLLLGQFFAWSAGYFVWAVRGLCGEMVMTCLLALLLSAPGVFFSSTALLPSAVASSMVMAAVGSWMESGHPRKELGRYYSAVFFGCLAVVSSGWPFVAVVFVPIGAHMVISPFFELPPLSSSGKGCNSDSVVRRGSGYTLILLLLGGAATLAATVLLVVTIDSKMFGKLTFPPLNIALYNVLNGSGDELYGVEPTSYYFKNLLLTVGLLSFPLALLTPITLACGYWGYCTADSPGANVNIMKTGKIGTIFILTFSWLALLLSRPHKEERFMYPIYPQLCFLAALSLETLVHIGADVLSLIGILGHSTQKGFRKWTALLFCALAFPMGMSRILASHRNYGGYFKLWMNVNSILSRSHLSKDLSGATAGTAKNICMGGEWYTFPSHFFVPSDVNLAFVEDTFHGLLPQYYASLEQGGAAAMPLQPMNDRNAEEPLRYVPMSSCDFFVLTMPSHTNKSLWSELSPLQQYVTDNALVTDCDAMGDVCHQLRAGVTALHCERLIDPTGSPVLARAFEIPFYSRQYNKFVEYCLLQNNAPEIFLSST